MVYAMLMASDPCRNAADFKDTDLYKKCVAAGVIPGNANAVFPEIPHVEIQDLQTLEPSPGSSQDPVNLSDRYLTFNFSITNMWCPACAWVIEAAITRSPGVIKASCNFSSDRGHMVYDPVKTSPEKIFNIIKTLGYTPAGLDGNTKKSFREFIRLSVTLVLTMNVMMLSWSIYSGFFIQLSIQSVQMIAWPAAVMTAIVVFYGGYPIHGRTVAGIRSGWMGMETLITTGSCSTYTYSLYQLFQGSLHLYFDAASMLILLILFGKKLEQSAKDRIAQGLSSFFSLVPRKVRLITPQFPGGRYVSIKQLSPGDPFLAEAGELLAADGIVTEGTAVIDESSITGEAKPVFVGLDDSVKSGTRVISGTIRIIAQKTGESSILGRMLAVMEMSLSGKTARAERFEILLKFFVPCVMGVSGLTWLFWILYGLPSHEAFNRGISVLVISCPCALGIAIPLALVAGVSAAGKKGILIRDFEAFERVEGLDTIVFDKTGTLTTGRMEVLGVDTAPDFPLEKARQIIHAMEQESDHYIAAAVRTHAAFNSMQPVQLLGLDHHSNGVTARYMGKSYSLGSLPLAAGPQARIPSFVSFPQQGTQVISTIYLSEEGRIVAAVHLGDSMKPGIQSLLNNLNTMGFTLYLISGDAQKATRDTAAFFEIPPQHTHGSMLPHEKAAFLQQLGQSNRKTAMVGDGVNDAPAMAQSDLAVAVHSGLHPGSGVAAITLMQETPVQLLDFIRLAKSVNQKVRQNLLFAFAYNVISIPVAACGLLNPVIAVIAMLLSSLSVIFNTLRLVKKESVPQSQHRYGDV